jgi:hypothetical protein
MCSISLHFHVLMDVGVSSNVLYLEGPNLGLDHVYHVWESILVCQVWEYKRRTQLSPMQCVGF